VSEKQAAEQEIAWFRQFELKNILVVLHIARPAGSFLSKQKRCRNPQRPRRCPLPRCTVQG
jgi:hypothetical protein